MGQALIKSKPEKPRGTMHDNDYIRVFSTVEKARAGEGRVCRDIRCPICGGPAFVFQRQQNRGNGYVGGCENGCWDLWE